MLIKAGVDISRLERNTRRGLAVVARILTLNDEELIITSTFDGNHGEGSLHYANQAFDIRLPKEHTNKIELQMDAALGEDFDLCREANHFHIEYDPKPSTK